MTHLIIIQGEERGREVTVPEAGIRVGRSHANDIVMQDDALSQFHCRFFFKSDQSLWVTDFASTNQTLVNDEAVSEARLRPGDRVEVGNAVFRVVRDTLAAVSDNAFISAPAPEAPPQEELQWEPAPEPRDAVPIDLGFGGSAAAGATPAGWRAQVRRLAWTFVGFLAIGVVAWAAVHFTDQDPVPRAGPLTVTPPLAVFFEKVEAGPENIFRYALRIEEGELHIQIDDLKNRRHVAREKTLDPEVLSRFTETLQATRFTTLQNEYVGLSPGIYNLSDLTIIVGPRAHRVKVLNRLEPEEFNNVREIIEEYGRAELGLAALAMTPARLIEMARQAYLEGRKRYEEREVRYGNLAESVRQFTLGQWYLETIEPKPDFYEPTVQGLERSRRELDERYNDYLFRAERAIKLKDWEDAARNLRIIQETIPDRSDERNQTTETKLLTVERYLRR